MSGIGLLLRGQFDSGDFAVFTGMGDVVWDGVTYQGIGSLLSIGNVQSSVANGKAGMTVTLSGIDLSVITIAETEDFQRRRVTIYLADFDDEGVIQSADVFFAGLADDMESSDDPSNPVLTLTLEQRAFDLSRPRPFKYLPQDQERRFPGDLFFNQVAVIQNMDDVWGG